MNRSINIILKFLIIVIFCIIVNGYITNGSQIQIDFVLLKVSCKLRWYYLLGAIILMPLNWMMETFKWRIVMNNYTNMSYSKAGISILCGITCGMITPARVGEFMGRLLTVEKAGKKLSIYASFICSLAQNVITLVFGLAACVLFILTIHELDISYVHFIALYITILSVVLILYFYHHKILLLFSEYNFYKKYLMFINVMAIPKSLLTKVLTLSWLRYSIYATQYALVLLFFGNIAPMSDIIISILTIFLLQSTIPLPPMIGLIARGEIAVFILGLLSYSSGIALMAAGMIWLLNLVLPALLGLFFIMKMNLWNSLKM